MWWARVIQVEPGIFIFYVSYDGYSITYRRTSKELETGYRVYQDTLETMIWALDEGTAH